MCRERHIAPASNWQRMEGRESAYDRDHMVVSGRCLNFHAGYRCRHSGVCCRTAWDLPFQRSDRERVERLGLGRGGHVSRRGRDVWLAAGRGDGACVFLTSPSTMTSAQIHGAAAGGAPRNVPDVPTHRPRRCPGNDAVVVALLPTAAGMLFDVTRAGRKSSRPLRRSTDIGPLDGLDARNAMPPLLREGVLMDLESFDQWERGAVAALTVRGVSIRARRSRVWRGSWPRTWRLVAGRPGAGGRRPRCGGRGQPPFFAQSGSAISATYK